MKKIFTSIVIINIIGIIIGLMIAPRETILADSSIEKDRLEMIKEKGIIAIAAPSKEIPFFWINQETNEMSGIDADIINEITRRLGVNKVEIKEVTFANLLDKFNGDDSIDIAVGGIFITPESENLAAFTQPLYKESETVIVPRFSKINFMSDLKNAVVGVEKGTIFEDLAKKWKENSLIKDVLSLDSTTDLFNAINNGKIDAGLADSIIINYYIKEKNPLLRQLKGYTPELQGVMGIAVKKDDVSLLNALDKAINDMKADGALYSILVKNGLDKNNMINN
ncbi:MULTISPECIES: ABC transporter substrate-binding protein [Clostridium]|uniref:Amino acid ABC transporter substrate-binding protein n=1 Tax=Clostridium beijerinckii TaxID=1520 RepID=A0A1S9N2T1_CLOBE|nr:MULTISPECIES: ABC transporter substrate-binding protein [Clostridium]MBN7573324.1 amino acid ABC transporter substrate-binding protein [Clostridium beijerinckii]MBN7578663.1 amino acid ABC transporter substrate-binding protein [Clostridium beijerinckii]MBN7583097.1 amino acid ABC transporter substrate-binding protein [Clostridium beijerinckii]MBO0519253.1 amino acid ABC transporter substrate-binding protein [Clostridium beijerinckii]MZK49221.1 transporter substrate-binding domain-containing